ncbi:MAG: putative DedA/PAP2 family phospholipid acid phosphatase [Pseudonocardia sp.]|nr:putative DedA/PAP2 family phospholipid acid phosphatase [Pseudonocardia sp.]
MLQFLQQVGEQVGGWLYLIAGFLVFGEAALMIGVVFPGETALLVAGLAAHQGYIGLWPMIAVAFGAAVLGDSVGYEFGRTLGPRLRGSGLGRRIGPARWESAEAFLGRHGGKAVLLGRFTAVLRALTPGVAGMTRMPYLRTFLPWNLAGAGVWGGGCVLLGYAFSSSLATIGRYLTWGPLLLIALLVIGYVLVRLRHRAQHP